jgi:hypothetical protein
MLVKDNEVTKYLELYHAGKIKKGLAIGCELDNYLRFKKGSLNMILGHDNVGKTYWRTWYYLVHAVKNNMKFCIWTGENKAGQIYRNLIKMYAQKDPKDMSLSELYRAKDELGQYFDFVDNKLMYKPDELLDLFKEKDYNCCLIDPYTGLDRDYDHSSNYKFMNNARQWANETGISLDICTHPISASGRAHALYPLKHPWEGHIRNPYKAEAEGGKVFQNRSDDFIVVHRISKHPQMKTYTLIYVDKIRDHETGGNETMIDEPVLCEFNNGYGFKIGGINPLTDKEVKPIEGYEQKPLTPLNDFDRSVEHAKENVEEDDLTDIIPF